VNPRSIFHKDFQELGCGTRAAPAPAGVLDVADVALDLFGVLFAEGQPPELLAGSGKCRVELGPGSIVIRNAPEFAWPRAITQAPVRVAASIRWVAPSCFA